MSLWGYLSFVKQNQPLFTKCIALSVKVTFMDLKSYLHYSGQPVLQEAMYSGYQGCFSLDSWVSFWGGGPAGQWQLSLLSIFCTKLCYSRPWKDLWRKLKYRIPLVHRTVGLGKWPQLSGSPCLLLSNENRMKSVSHGSHRGSRRGGWGLGRWSGVLLGPLPRASAAQQLCTCVCFCIHPLPLILGFVGRKGSTSKNSWKNTGK